MGKKWNLTNKFSSTTNLEKNHPDSSSDLENNYLVYTHNNLNSNDLQTYFDSSNRPIKVTSFEVNAPRPYLSKSEIPKLNESAQQERDKIVKLRKLFLEQK